MLHDMSLRPGPFEAIASGRKRYELRLNDEKRRQIRVGDVIRFTRTDEAAMVYARVISLHPFPDFLQLYQTLPLLECGYTPANVGSVSPDDMSRYYAPEKQRVHGVLGIGLELIRYPLEQLNGEYKVRLLSDDDLPQMLKIAQGNPQYYEYLHLTPTMENLRECLEMLPPRRTIADKHFFGWFDGERLIAMMDLVAHHPEYDKAFIGWFIVDKDWQGNGMGRALVTRTLEMLREAGVKEVRLGRAAGNPQAEHFWHVCGFGETGLSYSAGEYEVLVLSKQL